MLVEQGSSEVRGVYQLKFHFWFDSCPTTKAQASSDSTPDLPVLAQHYSQGVRHYLGFGLWYKSRPNFFVFLHLGAI